MKFTEGIFKRATVRGITDYLLFGTIPNEENRDYETRLKEAYLNYEKVALQYNKDKTSDLIESANDMASETASVYTEIGLQAGMLLMKDMMRNTKKKNDN